MNVSADGYNISRASPKNTQRRPQILNFAEIADLGMWVTAYCMNAD